MSNCRSLFEQFLEILDDGKLISFLLMADKKLFHFSGCVSKYNLHYWAEENP
jgi:hypothetical protein